MALLDDRTFLSIYVYEDNLSLVMRNPVFGISDKVRHKSGCTAQKLARGLKFRILVEEGLFYPYSENVGADQLICVLVFAYAKSRFSHNEAHFSCT